METYAIPVPPGVLAQTLDEAMSAARAMGFPVVVKIQSPEIAHKTEIGGVALGVGEAELPAAYERIMANAAKAVPDAFIEGILIQKMMPPGHEIVLGVVNDADFGPLVMLGAGGIYVEVLKDVVFSPPQIDEAEARRLIRRLKTAPILLGARGREPADETALARLIMAVGRLAIEQEGVIDQLDINPVFVYPQGEGVVAVDALVTRKGHA
jgi:acetyltransferase